MVARGTFVAAAALLVLPSRPALAVEPISQWTIEPSDVRCVAVRKYGSADKPITLALKAPPTGNAMQLAIIRHGYRNKAGQIDATVTVDGRGFTTYALVYPLGFPAKRSKQNVSLVHLPPEAAAAVRRADELGLGIKETSKDEFPLGNLKDVWADMDHCLQRLKNTWNVGEEYAGRIASEPVDIVPIQSMFSGDDYPPVAAWKSFSGTTSVLLLIDEQGAVKDCTLTESSGMAVIDSRTCALISYKGRFKPASGTDGSPIKSSWAKRITWRVVD
jgi:hypothetical protein